jgi:acylglycerol lipase
VAHVDVGRLRAASRVPHDLLRTSDGRTLFLRRWDASGPPPVSVLLLHGITAYSEPYGPGLAEPLARAGVTVFGMDLRGHGLSDGVRGDYPSRERLAQDLAEAVAFAKARSTRLVVVGHSLGALSAGLAEQAAPAEIDGVVLMSAGRRIRRGVYPRPGPGAFLRTLLGVALLRGRPLIEYRREGMGGRTDPLYNFRYSARFYSAMYGVPVLPLLRQLREGAIESPNLRFQRTLRVPLLVVVGDRDELIPVDSARELFELVDATDKEFLVVPGGRHTVFPPEVPDCLRAWLAHRF